MQTCDAVDEIYQAAEGVQERWGVMPTIREKDLSPAVLAKLLEHEPKAKKGGRGVRRTPGVMNKLESRYSSHLENMKSIGLILDWKFDAVKLRLADKCFYTPDFLVLMADMTIEFHEVKGYWEDDARVKVKVAAALYPFRFFAVMLKKNQFVVEAF